MRDARRKVELLSRFDVVIPEPRDVLAAIDLHRLHPISFWDAMIVRCAQQSGCSVVLSEDMQNQREIDGLKIINPFQLRREAGRKVRRRASKKLAPLVHLRLS
jgi:predicted nucleic acid-binding protein